MSTACTHTTDARAFESLACHLSTRLTNAPAGEVNDFLDPILAQIVAFFGIDRSSVAQFSADGRDFIVTHCCAPGCPARPTGQPGDVLALVYRPDPPRPAPAVQPIAGRRPRGSRGGAGVRPGAGLRSHLALPLAVGGTVLGGIGIATFGRVYEWTDVRVSRLRLIADVLANALGRQAAHRRELDLNERLAVREWQTPEATEATTGRVYLIGSAPEALWASGRKVRRFGSPTELLTATLEGPGCVVIDLDTTGLTGLDVHVELDARPLAPPVVLLTGLADPEVVVRAMKAGVVDVLTRPFGTMALQEAVARGVERHARVIREERETGELRRRYHALSPREREVMALVVAGHPNKVAGARLGICEKTVKAHRGAVMRKMVAGSLAALVRMADRLRTAAPCSREPG